MNVQVILRCRPQSKEELAGRAPVAVKCNESHREVCVYQNIAGKQTDRTYTFDKAFGPATHQAQLYDQAISPIVDEVLDGFNCTIFAYGQTGTGKTYTMEGELKDVKKAGITEHCGVIPRAVDHVFNKLEAQGAEYSVKATFLELYNEEITDLLAVGDDVAIQSCSSSMSNPSSVGGKQRLALMEDGKGGVIVRGLEEEIVKNSNEIFTVLQRGSSKRRSAETLLNKQSSRSHSVFTITIHIKEATPEGEELIKCGKLNLVDLAGSENVSRSGANMRPESGRTREAGEINKSLLTLGRVINALVEHQGHVPYRDSKLTRLLRDSLGGRTKTCIIATVAPTVHCLEETLSTLDYAHRAKNIRNKPEVNQKMTKNALLKDLNSEIMRLREDLNAARDKNGIYLSKERYEEEMSQRKASVAAVEVLEEQIAEKEAELEKLKGLFEEKTAAYDSLSSEHTQTKSHLEMTSKDLERTKGDLCDAKTGIAERDYLIVAKTKSEGLLVNHSLSLTRELDRTAGDVHGLFSKLDRKTSVEKNNTIVVRDMHDEVQSQVEQLEASLAESLKAQQVFFSDAAAASLAFQEKQSGLIGALQEDTAGMRAMLVDAMQSTVSTIMDPMTKAVDGTKNAVKTRSEAQLVDTRDAAAQITAAIDSVLSLYTQQQDANQRLVAQLCADQIAKANEHRLLAEDLHKKVCDGIEEIVSSARSQHATACEHSSSAMSAVSDLSAGFVETFTQAKMDMVSEFNAMMTSFVSKQHGVMSSLTAPIVSTLEDQQKAGDEKLAEMEKLVRRMGDGVNGAFGSQEAATTALIGELEATAKDNISSMNDGSKKMHVLIEGVGCAVEDSKQKQEASIAELNAEVIGMAESVASIAADGHTFVDAAKEKAVGLSNETCDRIERMASDGKDFFGSEKAMFDSQAAEASTMNARLLKEVAGVNNVVTEHVVEKMMVDAVTGETPSKRAIDVPSVSAVELLRCPGDKSVLEAFYAQKEGHERQKESDDDDLIDNGSEEEKDAADLPGTPGNLDVSDDVDDASEDDLIDNLKSKIGGIHGRPNGASGKTSRTPFSVIEGENSAGSSPRLAAEA